MEDKLQKYIEDIAKYVDDVNVPLVEALYKPLAGVLAQADGAYVAFSDFSELDTVKKNFIAGKLGIDDEEAQNMALAKVGETMSDDRTKSRCLLYTSPSPRDLSTSRMPSSA